MSFYDRLKLLAKEKNVSFAQIEKDVGLARNSLYNYKDKAKNPTSKWILSLASYFEVSTDYLLGKPFQNTIRLIDFLNILTSRNENLDVKIYCFESDIEIKPSTFKEGKLLFSTFDLCLKDDYWFGFKNLKDDIISETWIWHNREVVLVDTYPRNRVNGEWWLIAIR
ncbi:helix-turn-helix transcriptional regulator [Lactococcus petauri]|uniref:helix-turn-helix domain-containing protein n=1 Tax=Lactococcus petauri TaxID=1940789 RepID=UPI00232AC454|nr:helix-turn-helix transcriptional regulator [Lactococcus petauri]MDC0815863.1 helix-turn-helix transcriptional regulator [Lactococcus petauri]MDC0817906.1 helix-turn-helix transcriptional regulator [Lactococcus petauri]MDC0824298.1 helix-turn-helix transcriptional regulator [Lactococcus petauri]MDC0830881.1 helix-turn-helix transcriptional regulator [Lactococcus petauri]